MPIYQIILVIAVVILVLSLLLNLLFSPITWIIIAILVIYSFIRRYLYEKQLKEFREILAQSMTLPKNFTRDVILKAPSKDIMNTLTKSILTLASYDDKASDISMENELGSFDLDREFSWFEGIVNWNGVEANVYLETDEEDGDTAEQAMKVLKELVDNIVDNDNKYRAFAAQELTELANEWLEDSDEIDTEKITRELFKKRMEISSITVSPDGSLSLFYNDDDMFWGHIIEIVVEPNGEIISANIAG